MVFLGNQKGNLPGEMNRSPSVRNTRGVVLQLFPIIRLWVFPIRLWEFQSTVHQEILRFPFFS